MEIRELRYFVALAEELHFARAAARVGIEQSPFSKAISEFERHLGVQLFVRTRRSTTITGVGEVLLQDARRILSDVDHARRNIQATASGRRGRLRIGLCDGLAHPRISRLLAQSRADDPEVDFRVMHQPFAEQLRSLCSGTIDIGIALAASDDPKLRCIPLWRDPAVLLVRPGDRFADCGSVAELEATLSSLIVLGCPTSIRTLSQEGILGSARRHCAIECVPTIELLLTLVAAGYGIGLLSTTQAETIHREDLLVRPLSPSDADVTTFLVSRNEDHSTLSTRFSERALRMVRTGDSDGTDEETAKGHAQVVGHAPRADMSTNKMLACGDTTRQSGSGSCSQL